jgi:hypothetical protein
MSAVPIQQMADRVAGLMEERLRVRGVGLAEKLRKGGRLLPRKVRAQADILAQYADMAQNPKLLLQVDHGAVAAAYDACVRHLGGIGVKERRMGALMDFGASVAFAVLAAGVLVLSVLYWRGFI